MFIWVVTNTQVFLMMREFFHAEMKMDKKIQQKRVGGSWLRCITAIAFVLFLFLPHTYRYVYYRIFSSSFCINPSVFSFLFSFIVVVRENRKSLRVRSCVIYLSFQRWWWNIKLDDVLSLWCRISTLAYMYTHLYMRMFDFGY